MRQAVFRRVHSFLATMAGHIIVLLTVGMSLAAMLSLFVAEQARHRDFERIRAERVAASAVDIAGRLQHNPEETQAMLLSYRIMGASAAPAGIAITTPDKGLERLLAERLGSRAQPEAGQVPSGLCFAEWTARLAGRAAGIVDPPLPDCWIVRFTDMRGERRALAIHMPGLSLPPSSLLSPLYLLLVIASATLLSILVARFAAQPLRRLERAAKAFSVSLDPEPIPETGPEEVRAALATFNLMQRRVRDGFRERTQLLAAISHDLQTPITRLRLRLEQVADEDLRAKLVQDLAAMHTLVREGLDLASSSDSGEEWSMVDIDSLLTSLAEDAEEFGNDVRFVAGCGGVVRIKPNALTRCLSNLIDNAVKYAGSAEIGCRKEGGHLLISVRDYGPGIAPELLEKIFEPFTRGDPGQPGGRSGTGIGLTIARSQAMTFGATVRLGNAPGGGLLAVVDVPL